jgi:hypothetical protein
MQMIDMVRGGIAGNQKKKNPVHMDGEMCIRK